MIIWDMKIPPRIKVFLWRVSRNVIPTRMGLKDKGVKIDGKKKKTVMKDCISAAVMPSSLQQILCLSFSG